MLDGYVDLNQSGVVITDRMLGGTTARTGVGLYSTTLEDQYVELLSAQLTLICQTNTGLSCQVVKFTDGVDESLAPVSVMQWKLVNSSGVPTDVIDGAAVTISLKLKNSSV